MNRIHWNNKVLSSYCFLMFFIIFFSIHSYSQNSTEIDSLRNELHSNNTNKEKIQLLNTLSAKLEVIEPDTAFNYATLALELSKTTANKEGELNAIFNLGVLTYNNLQYEKALDLYKDGARLAKEYKLPFQEADHLMKIARWYRYRTKDRTTTFKYFNECLEVSKKSNYIYGLARCNAKLAGFHAQKNEVSLALSHLETSKDYYLQINNEEDIAHYYNEVGERIRPYDSQVAIDLFLKGNELFENYPGIKVNLGKAYLSTGNKELALKFFKEATIAYQDNIDLRREGMVYTDISEVYLSLNKLNLANLNVDKSISIFLNLPPRFQTGLPNAYRMKAHILEKKKEFDKALAFYKKSLDLSIVLDGSYDEALTNLDMGLLQLNHLKNINKGILFCNESLDLSQGHNYVNIEILSCECLYQANKRLNNNSDALYFLEKKVLLGDTMQLLNFKQSMDSLSTVYKFKMELAKKDILLSKEASEQLIKDEKIANQSNLNWALTFAIFLSITFIAMLFRGLVKTREQNKIIQIKNNEIELKTKELEKVNTIKDKIFAVIGHDLRGPLRNLKSFLDLIIDKKLSQDKFMDVATVLRRDTTASYEALENLLNWGNIQFQGKSKTTKSLNVSFQIEKLKTFFLGSLELKELSFSMECDQNLTINTDPDRLELVLRNLIANAVKFTNRGGKINVVIKETDSEIAFSIKDNGIGIEENNLESIFKAGNSTYGTENERGTGIGLGLCKEIIEFLGGKINVESERGKGSNFMFTLPK